MADCGSLWDSFESYKRVRLSRLSSRSKEADHSSLSFVQYGRSNHVGSSSNAILHTVPSIECEMVFWES